MAERALIIGLGNPGREYAKNRHNVGFQIVDRLAARHGLAFTRLQSKAAIASGVLSEHPVVIAKPQTYMNLSGGAVGSLVKFYKVLPEQLIVVSDDLDLPVGTLRLRPSGSSGGQNGIRDIIDRLGTNEFPRLRVGIGRPPGRMNAAAYVLQDFSAIDLKIIEDIRDKAADAIETWLIDGITLAMSRYNAPAQSGEPG